MSRRATIGTVTLDGATITLRRADTGAELVLPLAVDLLALETPAVALREARRVWGVPSARLEGRARGRGASVVFTVTGPACIVCEDRAPLDGDDVCQPCGAPITPMERAWLRRVLGGVSA